MMMPEAVEHLLAADRARDEMLTHLTRALVSLDRSGGGASNEARTAVNVAREAAYVDGDGGPVPRLIVQAVLAVARLALEEDVKKVKG